MKKLNNKGNTLIELIISIELMSVVLVSMVRLLVDLNNTNTNSVYAKNNEVVRSEIIRAIETDLNNYKLSYKKCRPISRILSPINRSLIIYLCQKLLFGSIFLPFDNGREILNYRYT